MFLLYRHDTVIKKSSALTHVVIHRLPPCIPDHTGHDGTSLNRCRAAELLSQNSLAVLAFHCSYARHSKINQKNRQKRVFSERQCSVFTSCFGGGQLWPNYFLSSLFLSFKPVRSTPTCHRTLSKMNPTPGGTLQKWHPFCGLLKGLREAKPGGVQTRVFPTFFGKGPDCVADPFGTVPRRCS